MESDRRGRGLTRPPLLTTGGRLWLALLLGLSGCGSPASEPAPMAEGTSAGSATGAASKSTEAAAPEQERSAPMQPSARGLTASPLPTQPSLRRIESSREITPAPEARAPSTAASSDRQQREAWTQWYAAMRESPDSTVRLQALEQWAQQPGAPLDPVTYALVDGDEAVRARAQDLYSHQLTREAVAAPPTPKAGEGPQAAP